MHQVAETLVERVQEQTLIAHRSVNVIIDSISELIQSQCKLIESLVVFTLPMSVKVIAHACYWIPVISLLQVFRS